MYWKMQFLYKIFWQNKMLCRPTIPSFFTAETWNTHVYISFLPNTMLAPPVVLFYSSTIWGNVSLGMRKPVYATCEQQRRRSACTSAQSDQHLCCSLPRYYNISSFYIRNFKTLATFCSWPGWFESYLVANPEDRFFSQCGSYWNVGIL